MKNDISVLFMLQISLRTANVLFRKGRVLLHNRLPSIFHIKIIKWGIWIFMLNLKGECDGLHLN